MNHNVFISYSNKDKTAADAICHVLEENQVKCWMAPRDIPAGAEYGDLIDAAIKQAQVFVLVFSQDAAESPWVKGEINIAFEEQKVIIPFRLDSTPLSGQNRVMLNQKHWIDAYPEYEKKISSLVNAVLLALGRDSNTNEIKPVRQQKNFIMRHLATAAAALLVLIGIYFISLFAIKFLHSYSYDKNGLHVKVRKLTTEQEEALSSILDNMVLVEGGSFIIGQNKNPDFLTKQDSLSLNPHKVEVDNYYICKYELRQSEWKAFLPLDGKCIAEGENTAMDMLSWEDADGFARLLSEITGLNFSLPTEAQWEYAARGGKKSKGYLFSGYSEDGESVGRVAWTAFDGISSAQDVGLKQQNELGLYDMTGNVSEWCMDYYGTYEKLDQKNPKGPSGGLDRVYRGGDFRTPNLWDMKTSTRFYSSPFTNRKATGLRLVINISEN